MRHQEKRVWTHVAKPAGIAQIGWCEADGLTAFRRPRTFHMSLRSASPTITPRKVPMT